MKIFFESSWIFDQHISELMNSKFDRSKVTEVEALVPKLNNLWPVRGAELLSTACKISGFRFKQTELKCILTVSDFVSMSHPLIVNVKRYLTNSDAETLFEVIFHELLHVLLDDNCKVWPTKLIENEANQTVQSHLHLMSLEKAVHLELGNNAQLEKIGLWYNRIGGAYKDSWETIDQAEVFRDFLNEFKDPEQWGRRHHEN